VLFQREPGRRVVVGDVLGERHPGQRDALLPEEAVGEMRREQGRRLVEEAAVPREARRVEALHDP
jgi:hypothetical protein